MTFEFNGKCDYIWRNSENSSYGFSTDDESPTQKEYVFCIHVINKTLQAKLRYKCKIHQLNMAQILKRHARS